MNRLEVCFTPHKEISRAELSRIIRLKEQRCPRGYSSHLRWINENIRDEDIHVTVKGDGCLIAYIDLIWTTVSRDGERLDFLGAGNLCVCKEKSGMGVCRFLLDSVGAYLLYKNVPSILLCRENVSDFYIERGWSPEKPRDIYIGGQKTDCCLLSYHAPGHWNMAVHIDRSF